MSTELKLSKVSKNPDGLSSMHIEAILRHFGRVQEAHADLAREAVEYLIDGGSDEILLRLGGSREIAEALVLSQQQVASQANGYRIYERASAERASILWPAQQAPIHVWVRVAQVFASLFRAMNIHTTYKSFPHWLTVLFGLAIATTNRSSRGGRPAGSLYRRTIADWRALFKHADIAEENLIPILLKHDDRQAFFTAAGNYATMIYYYGQDDFVTQIEGWIDLLREYPIAVRQSLTNGDAAGKVFTLQTLTKVKYDFEPIVELVVDAATGAAKSVRQEAIGCLNSLKAKARPLLEAKLRDGDTSERNEAAIALFRLAGPEAIEHLTQIRLIETSERVQQTIDKLIAAPKAAAEAYDLNLPPLNVEIGSFPLPETGRNAIHEFFAKSYRDALAHYQKTMAEYEAAADKRHHYRPHQPKEVTASDVDQLIAYVEGARGVHRIGNYAYNKAPFGDWFAPPDVKLVHVIRLAAAFSQLNCEHRNQIWWPNRADLDSYRSRCQPPFGLRELDAAVADVFQCGRGRIAKAYLLNNNRYWTFCDWESEAIWPLFAEFPEILRNVLSPGCKEFDQYQIDNARDCAFRVLAKFPKLPPEFIPLLWEIALGESKSPRYLAQDALATVPDKSGQILVALDDGKQTIRAAAAEWLGKLGDAKAIGPLKEAFRTEKQEGVKGTIMAALDALGADVDEFLDREQLLKEAEAGLKKKRPKGIDWLPFDQFPAIHWQDTGKAVNRKVVEWWLIQLIQHKSPAPGPLLRRYLGMCKPDETARLAQFTLRAWIGRDTQALSHEEASERARAETDKLWNAYSKHQYWIDHYQGNKENLYKEQHQKFSTQCIQSAINEKGMLAFVAATGDRECVKLCEQYVRQWFGQKLAQCKALVEVLAWIDHPNAVQVLLSIANRFRTKAIREAANEHVQALAERQGWTLDELADRTIPDGGFERPTDEEGRPIGHDATLVLDYGPRKFFVKLNDDLEPVIATEDGKTVKSPPAPGKNDDPEMARVAKKAFSDGKKTIKDVVKRQAERFYEGLCTQRIWRYDDWRTYLAHHPVVGRLVGRLVWSAFDGTDGDEKFRGCFRMLEDGSLTNEADEEVQLAPETKLRLAHTCNVPAELESIWLQHLKDYDVDPLFAQFQRPIFQVPDAKKKDTSITDFEGYMLTTFKLRGKATKLGYLRGQAEDGGCFMNYHKPFSSLGIEAVINFSGSMLPEQDIPAALYSLEFQRLTNDATAHWLGASGLTLEKVPPVLLSECYNDMKQIAAEGTGFQVDWKSKSYF